MENKKYKQYAYVRVHMMSLDINFLIPTKIEFRHTKNLYSKFCYLDSFKYL